MTKEILSKKFLIPEHGYWIKKGLFILVFHSIMCTGGLQCFSAHLQAWQEMENVCYGIQHWRHQSTEMNLLGPWAQ